ncbi:hypothetical protein [Micromonospora haikouensis]|uniref:hypothetical protein n=1 Tax=Micromonospora haikouensis TaxID=686309 RepID=UPI003D749752
MPRQPDQYGIALGDLVLGRCVTNGTEYQGTVAEIIPPARHSGQHGNRYNLTGTGKVYSTGGRIEPIVERAALIVRADERPRHSVHLLAVPDPDHDHDGGPGARLVCTCGHRALNLAAMQAWHSVGVILVPEPADDDHTPDWRPLEALLPADKVGAWMWMARVRRGHRVIEQYKHSSTRAHINLDQDSRAWRVAFSDASEVPDVDPVDIHAALAYALA